MVTLKLKSINKLLNIFGLKMVVSFWDGVGPRSPTLFKVMSIKRYKETYLKGNMK